MRNFKDESGQVLVLVALSMTVLIGFVGFATDVGVMLRERRIAQTAADSAAIGAATEALNQRNWTTVTTGMYNAAVLDASLNGFTTGAGNGTKDSSTGVSLSVNAGANITIPGYSAPGNFQAIVSKTTPTTIMSMFGFPSIDVTATAIASNTISSGGCGHMNNGNNYNLAGKMGGSSELFAIDCGITVNGTLDMNGNSNVTAEYVVSTGAIENGGSSNVTGQVSQNVGGVISDPWQYLQSDIPTLSGTTCTAPGGMSCIYDQGCGATSCSLSGTLAPNTLYYYDKGVTITSTVQSPSSGGGNTIYLAGTQPYLDFAVNGTVNITPPAPSGTSCVGDSNPLCGVVIDAPQAGNDNVAPNRCVTGKGQNYQIPGELYFDFGSSTGTLEGDLYAPYMELFVQDQGASFTLANDFVIGTFCSQAATLKVAGFSGPLNPNTRVGLVY